MSEDAGDQSDEDADESLEETMAGNDNHLISLVPDISAFSVCLYYGETVISVCLYSNLLNCGLLRSDLSTYTYR